jgi:hypothetical protein
MLERKELTPGPTAPNGQELPSSQAMQIIRGSYSKGVLLLKEDVVKGNGIKVPPDNQPPNFWLRLSKWLFSR